MIMDDRLHVMAAYNGPLFIQRLRLVFLLLRSLHRIGRGQFLTFDAILL